MEMISRISRGSVMDQVYLPKNRLGLAVGSYVLIKSVETESAAQQRRMERPFHYHLPHLEPLKLNIIREIFGNITQNLESYDNIIITGSFLEPGFNFNDVDILLISEEKEESRGVSHIKRFIKELTGVPPHLLVLDRRTLIQGLSSDPLYQMMLSKCVAQKRLIYKIQPKINYKLLDLHLLNSKLVLDNFDLLDGQEKYYLTINMLAIALYLKTGKVGKDQVDGEIKRIFNLENSGEIKRNLVDKKEFLKKYTLIYNDTWEKIMAGIKRENNKEKITKGIKDGSKQK